MGRKKRRLSSLSERDPSCSDNSQNKSKKSKKQKKDEKKPLTETERIRKYRMYTMKDSLKRLNNIPIYKIPEYKLKNALNLLDNPKSFDNNKNLRKCTQTADNIDGRKYEIVGKDITKLLKEARKFLLKRNWNNLAKILCKIKPMDNINFQIYFTILKTYSEICLIHNPDEKLLKNFKTSVLSSNDIDIDDIKFRKITRKFDDNYDSDKDKDENVNESDNDDEYNGNDEDLGISLLDMLESDNDDDDDDDDDD